MIFSADSANGNEITNVKSAPSDPTHAMEKDETEYQLVLFTTEDGFSPQKLQKIRLFRDMSDLFHAHYKFRSILFTTTPQLIQSLTGSSIIIGSDFVYGLEHDQH